MATGLVSIWLCQSLLFCTFWLVHLGGMAPTANESSRLSHRSDVAQIMLL
ncbi:hypothetical protein KC19_5G045400 [Ceratodon purpureus]|uniref:Uncharacterized protein n=1 Tax=Ceratodon purpureus TaxID=3225 RepID=A0A8T0HZ74_CERPU|nr:hypothetical protein KC19_5G045400 [Ceratodon purpureus]